MNIGFLISDVTLNRGGERAAITLANALAENHQVTIVSLYRQNEQPFFAVNKKIRLKYINGSQAYRLSIQKILLKIRELKEAKKHLNMHSVDIWIGVSTYCSFLLGVLNWFNRTKKLIAWEHSNFDAAGRFWKTLRQFCYKRIDAIVCLTVSDQNKYHEKFSNVVVIPNALPFSLALPSNLSSKIVLAVGALEHEKGFDLLIKAFAQIANEIDWKLHIVGSGSEERMLMELIITKQLEDKVTMYPATTNIEEVYANAALFVLPSRREGFGMVLIEAMHFGLPCIAFNCPTGPSSIITNHANGILVANGDVNDLAIQIKTLIQNQGYAEKLALNAKLTLAKYELNNILPQWCSLFKNLVL